jgi:23S rRNA (cytidine2498-2'-O)-methyltransferase
MNTLFSPGDWLLTTRQDFEIDALEELAFEPGLAGAQVGPSLVRAAKRPSRDPAFGRQGFPVAAVVSGDELAPGLAATLRAEYERLCAGKRRPYTLHVFVPDADQTNPLSDRAARLASAILPLFAPEPEIARRHIDEANRTRELDGVFLQVCLYAPDQAAAGALLCTEAVSLFPGGRARLRMLSKAPSRAALKLEEAFLWLRRSPEAGELCADLGAAPGGWTYVLLERRARVFAVDPAKLAPDIASRKGVKHFCQSAFQFEPPEPVSWLCCDMAWRPMEAAQLLAKWGKRRWASFLVSNIKLPMKKKAEFVRELRHTIAGGGWNDVTVRQLYHDREEVTFGAWRAG